MIKQKVFLNYLYRKIKNFKKMDEEQMIIVTEMVSISLHNIDLRTLSVSREYKLL